MTHKTSEIYTAVFRYIEENILNTKPTIAMTDYEDGLRKAIKECWSNVDLRGCWWHHKRAVHRKCISFGMAKLFNRSAGARLIKRMLTNIPLLPKESIREGFDNVVEYARQTNLFTSFQKVFAYYEQYWLNQVYLFFTLPTDLDHREFTFICRKNVIRTKLIMKIVRFKNGSLAYPYV